MTNAKLINITTDYMQLLKTAAGQCYQQEASDKVIKHIIEEGHLSVLEHCSATFSITCSMSVLLQLTRHRHLSFTVQSSRGSKLNSLHRTGIHQIDRSNGEVLNIYKFLIEKKGYSCEEAAYILPKAAEYKMVATGNFRTWFEYLPKRLCKRALPEHQQLAKAIHKELAFYSPEIFDRNMLHCSTCMERSCSFHVR